MEGFQQRRYPVRQCRDESWRKDNGHQVNKEVYIHNFEDRFYYTRQLTPSPTVAWAVSTREKDPMGETYALPKKKNGEMCL